MDDIIKKYEEISKHTFGSLTKKETINFLLNLIANNENDLDEKFESFVTLDSIFTSTESILNEVFDINKNIALTLTSLYDCVGMAKVISAEKELSKTFSHDKIISMCINLIAHKPVEYALGIFLDNKLKIKEVKFLYQGVQSSTVCDFNVITNIAYESNSVYVVFCHNHPYAFQCLPSTRDIDSTINLKSHLTGAGLILLDDIIVQNGLFFSAKLSGMMDMITCFNDGDVTYTQLLNFVTQTLQPQKFID